KLDEQSGDTMLSTLDASAFSVFIGKDGPGQMARKAPPAAKGSRVFTAETTSLFPDIALIVLDRKVKGSLARLRLDAGASQDESLRIVGYGVTESDQAASERMQRDVNVLAVDAQGTTRHQLHTGEFEISEAACFGDSGGPAVSSATNAVVGVASR